MLQLSNLLNSFLPVRLLPASTSPAEPAKPAPHAVAHRRRNAFTRVFFETGSYAAFWGNEDPFDAVSKIMQERQRNNVLPHSKIIAITFDEDPTETLHRLAALRKAELQMH